MNVTDTTTPIAVARRLLERGWSPLPIPARSKGAPPTGFTGYNGRYVTARDVEAWTWDGNVAIRLPPDVVGVDVDVYHGGDQGLDELQQRYGILPTTVWSTSREDGSGIALFRVPAGTTLATDPAQGIDMIQAHHRYMVVHPSLHPEGAVYQWIDEASDEFLDAPPEPGDLPELPWGWVEGLAVAKSEAARAATPDEVRAFIDAHTRSLRPAALRGVQSRLAGYRGARHDTLVEVACWAMREAAAGYYPAAQAVETLWAWWKRVMDDPHRLDGGEFGSAIMWAVAQVANEPERVAELASANEADFGKPGERIALPNVLNHESPAQACRSCGSIAPPEGFSNGACDECGAPLEQIAESWTNLPDAFWDARPVFGHIRRAAHAQMMSADAVLLSVLARVVTLTPPNITLPAIVGSRASLNLFVAVVDSSGGGKTGAIGVARDLLPHDRKDVIDPILPSSGEGIIDAFIGYEETTDDDGKKRKERKQTKVAGLVVVDEGQGLLDQASRSGSIVLPTIRSGWMGGDLGQHNATEERKRWLQAHRYRLCMVMGFQLAYAADLIADGEGGTPQRFAFTSANDPSLVDGVEWPGALEWTPPATVHGFQDVAFHPDIAHGVRQRRLGRVKGTIAVDPLDTHADLRRMKLAAALAILDERLEVTLKDWELAAEIDQTSCAVRSLAVEYARAHSAQRERARAEQQAEREAFVADTVEERANLSGAKSIGRRCHKLGARCARRDLMTAPSGRARKVGDIDRMLEIAEQNGWIRAVEDGYEPGESRPA